MKDIEIIREFKEKVQDFFPRAGIYFYGSRVKKNHRDDSGYDVPVILNDVNSTTRKKIYDIAWETGFKYDASIAPVLSSKDYSYSARISPFWDNVKHHGLAL
ncbi:MAG: nucleotidyltransferase domain-containing protein [Candidatus Aminicenantes bacterium]|nr:nucleotidyltransferase domain-containing protein [Candidatus Aminicenantes bacterium]